MREHSFYILQLIEQKIPPNLKALPIDEVRPYDLQAFLNELALSYSKSYLDKILTMLRSLFEDAIDNELCSRNPARKLKRPNIRENPRQSFTIDEVRKILRYTVCYPDRFSVGTATMILTGLRKGELLGLKWSDLADSTLSVNRGVFMKNKRPCVEEYQAKTDTSLRTVILPPEIAYLLHTLPRYSEFIFGSNKGTLMWPRNFTRSYNAFFRRLQEVEPDVRLLPPHCCRHTFATLMLDSGANLRIVQDALGHASIQTTARYMHPDHASMQAAVDTFRKKISD